MSSSTPMGPVPVPPPSTQPEETTGTTQIPQEVRSVNREKAIESGVRLCRAGRWEEGYPYLRAVAVSNDYSRNSGLYLSFLGYSLARIEKRYRDGISLCKRAIDLEFYQPEHYLNLARIYMLRNSHRPAMAAVTQGLRVDPSNRELLIFRRELDMRRPPVIRFLSRDHALNQVLGRFRHALLGARPSADPSRFEDLL